ncbi:hypothetical protein DH2020_039072 [Rehmannia glutinosa]|uniref:BZIP domain-containing protein n=1 Tax=Rehmannia glutinosa TaxID=99300 RepID=A0ABR0UXZ6_REHGL
MADATVVSVDPPPVSTTGYDCGLSVPPFDAAFFSQHLFDDDDDGSQGDNQNDNVIDDLDFDFSFDDLYLPSADDLDDLLNPTQILEFGSQHGQDANFPHFGSNSDQFHAVSKSNSEELRHISAGVDSSGDRSSMVPGRIRVPATSTCHLPNRTGRIVRPLRIAVVTKISNWPSPESRGSGNFRSNISEDSNNCVTRSEKDCEDLPSSTVESSKCRKSNCNPENSNNNNNIGGLSEEEEKRKARLIRNRESAQLSRQRKKHYVDELEEKVRMMHSTIQDLNVKISYFMAENATLRQQMGGGGAVPPPPMAPQPPGMYPHPAMMYPWMPCAPPYMVKPQGSQVPLVPNPKLKPQQPVQAPKVRKKAESKKNEGPKTKKVASVSFLGLLFFIMLFGGLVPMVNMRYGGIRETLTGGESYVGGGFYEKHHGRVLMVNGTEYGEKHSDRRDFSTKSSVHCDQRGHDSGGSQMLMSLFDCATSEPLVASLYVPRNDKLVKIDGNLIIHSVLASEKAMNGKGGVDTGLALPGDLGPSIHVPGVRSSGGRHPQLRALGSGSADEVGRKPTDGRRQQWFREGLAGPMLSSGMCTEVFQFDVSSASASSGAIVPATTITTRNISEEQNQNSTHLNRGRNRRILHGHPIPLPESSHNISRQHAGRNSQKENLNVNNTVSPMVVSVLVDPREAGDADVDGVIGGAKSLSRIFVVVLVDSVKYVTYSCMLPFKGSVTHLVTT